MIKDIRLTLEYNTYIVCFLYHFGGFFHRKLASSTIFIEIADFHWKIKNPELLLKVLFMAEDMGLEPTGLLHLT